MMHASFDEMNSTAAISGAYQYDTGQRLKFSGLPSPDVLGESDDFLSGDLVTVQAHFSYEGDEQAQMRLVQWDDDRMCWFANVPDEYLTRHEKVNVFVVISHGADDNGSRNKTSYKGVFIPIARPAPNNVVSEDQLERWEELEAEVNLSLISTQAASDNALGKVEVTNDAAEDAAEASEMAEDAAKEAKDALARLAAVNATWAGMQAARTAGSEAGATLSGTKLTLTLPTGATGSKGTTGATGNTGPADIELSFANGTLTITPK